MFFVNEDVTIPYNRIGIVTALFSKVKYFKAK